MAIKAGRVGVAPDQVDEFGKINSEATTGYTKQEADAKFETKTHAASTYETKSDAAALQPKTLEVPIHMLHGSVLTVESGLQELEDNKVDDVYSVGTISSNFVMTDDSYLRKQGHIVDCSFVSTDAINVTAPATLFTLPEGFRPTANISSSIYSRTSNKVDRGYIDQYGAFNTPVDLSDVIRVHCTFIVP